METYLSSILLDLIFALCLVMNRRTLLLPKNTRIKRAKGLRRWANIYPFEQALWQILVQKSLKIISSSERYKTFIWRWEYQIVCEFSVIQSEFKKFKLSSHKASKTSSISLSLFSIPKRCFDGRKNVQTFIFILKRGYLTTHSEQYLAAWI